MRQGDNRESLNQQQEQGGTDIDPSNLADEIDNNTEKETGIKGDTWILDKLESMATEETGIKSDTDSMSTEVENTRKASDGVIDIDKNGEEVNSNNKDFLKEISDSILSQKISLGNYFDETNIDDLRNDTPTCEAWRTGQVPSPLKRGKSCKTPSPPPRPDVVTKADSFPTSGGKSRNNHGISSGINIQIMLK
jgi:hypothetical protein